MPSKHLLLILFVLSSCISSQAQELWSLEKCVQYAIDNSLTIKQASIAIQNAALTEKGNKYSRYPNLNGSASFGYQFGRTVDQTTNDFSNERIGSNSISLNSNVILYNGRRINNSIKQSKHDVVAAREDASQTVNDIALNVATAYINVLFAEEQLTNAKKRGELTQKQLEQTDKLIRAGSLPQNDRLDILAQIARDEQTVVGQQNNVDFAYLNLKQLLELEPDSDLKIDRPTIDIPKVSEVDGLNLKMVYQEALGAQPFIRAGEARLRSAELDIPIARAGLLPRLSLFASIDTRYSTLGKKIAGFESVPFIQNFIIDGNPVEVESTQNFAILEDNKYFDQINENLGQSLGLSLSVPIYNNHQSRISMERAELNITNTKIGIERDKQRLKSDIQSSLADARAAKKQLDAAEKTINALRAAYANAEKRYSLGAINTFNLTTAKNSLDTAEVDFIVAKYDYLFKLKIVDYYRGKPLR